MNEPVFLYKTGLNEPAFKNLLAISINKTIHYGIGQDNLPEQEIVTGVGNVTVKIPNVRDRSGGGSKYTPAKPGVLCSQPLKAV
ncbi:hypothetical protein [Methylomicrobium sp. Wu6]|uniref:hypothetical protein n=1 Tax=Methylomicrobium sp. Wu6 TaxID=3107928 RepID=UPI002DD64F8F|nr:hypothetical protein [Methylomicrobium sp. Wu6]MEC4749171.1 hypothetical protein [Methylomicrobium sp. Wu6]